MAQVNCYHPKDEIGNCHTPGCWNACPASEPTRILGECQWFALCDAPAHREVKHPVLGWVPTCDHHIAWLEDNAKEVR